MTTLNIQPVILCGGSGTRLWPLSREKFPKQFLDLLEGESLFQLSINRFSNFSGEKINKPIIVSNDEHKFLVLSQLLEIGIEPASVILEPYSRNTAPALTLAAHAAIDNNEDPILIVTPSDHFISDTKSFVNSLQDSIELAESGSIVLLGVTPDRPETGFGYIKTSAKKTTDGKGMIIEKFVEKPKIGTAIQYLKDGGYYWNSGIFVMRASVWLKAINQFHQDIAKNVKKSWEDSKRDNYFIKPSRENFESCPNESIDYAVMEKAVGVFDMKIIPISCGWNDLGSWNNQWEIAKKDEHGNYSKGDTIINDCKNVFVHSSGRLVSVVGINNAVIVETDDAVLVIDKDRTHEAKEIVSTLRNNNREEYIQHRKVFRPWGWYDKTDEGKNFKVKRIMVNPGASLSLQKHSKRAEHWVVVSGTAKVTRGLETIILHENQSTYIPVGEVHRLSNPTTIPLEIIEVQSGSYLGEDDIIRLEDEYNRLS